MSEQEERFQQAFIDLPNERLKAELTALRVENTRLRNIEKAAKAVIENRPNRMYLTSVQEAALDWLKEELDTEEPEGEK